MVSQSRIDAGWNFPWYLAEVSYHGSSNLSMQEPIAAGQRLSIHGDALTFFGPGTVALDDAARAAFDDADATALAAHPAVARVVDAAFDAVAANRPVRPPSESFTKLALIRLDALWAEHLLNMSYLKESVQLRTLQQTDPYQEYQREGFELFTSLQTKIKADTIYSLLQLAKE